MNRLIESDVIIYHDETECAGTDNIKGHVLLFVPIRTNIEYRGGLFRDQKIQIKPWSFLSKKFEEIRKDPQANHKFHFSPISGNKWVKRNEFDKKIVQLGVESLKQGDATNASFCKLGIIFYENPKPNSIASYGGESKKERRLRFGETILRMLLKGTIHHLYDSFHNVKILKIITDGQAHHRKLSDFRILEKLIDEVRNYVEIHDEAVVAPLTSNHKNHDKRSEEYIHANFLQLADMLLGSTIHVCLKDKKIQSLVPRVGDIVEDKKGIIACPVKKMLDKRKRGRNFKYSSHFRSFNVSMALIRNGEWDFKNVMAKEIQIDRNTRQIKLFDY